MIGVWTHNDVTVYHISHYAMGTIGEFSYIMTMKGSIAVKNTGKMVRSLEFTLIALPGIIIPKVKETNLKLLCAVGLKLNQKNYSWMEWTGWKNIWRKCLVLNGNYCEKHKFVFFSFITLAKNAMLEEEWEQFKWHGPLKECGHLLKNSSKKGAF